MNTDTRPISWIKAALRDFEAFPEGARIEFRRALAVVAAGGHPDIAKPLRGFGSGVLELAIQFRGEALRMVYAVQIGSDIWVVHAFLKKSKSGIRTPRRDVDLVHERLKRLRELLK